MKKENLILIITIILLALWVPVVIDKIMEFRNFKIGMLRQPIPFGMAPILVWILPFLEISTIVLLLNKASRIWGMYLSLFLMILFTGYIGLGLFGVWENTGCSCGSVISSLTQNQHFWFNLLYTIVSAAGIYIMKKHQNSDKGFVTVLGSGQPQRPIKHN